MTLSLMIGIQPHLELAELMISDKAVDVLCNLDNFPAAL